jgi:hypothetical protein
VRPVLGEGVAYRISRRKLKAAILESLTAKARTVGVVREGCGK